MPRYMGSGGGVKLGDSPTWTGTHRFNVNPIITNSAPGIVFTDTTGAAKSLTIAVDANLAEFRESAGAAGSLLVLDLTQNTIGLGRAPSAGILFDAIKNANALTYANIENTTDGTSSRTMLLLTGNGGNAAFEVFAPSFNVLTGFANSTGYVTNYPSMHLFVANAAGVIKFGINSVADATAGELMRLNASGNLGLGIVPTARFHVVGTAPVSVGTTPGTAATDSLIVTGAVGGATSIATTGVAGVGALLSLIAGAGSPISTATTAATGGKGGAFTTASGAGGAASAATGNDTGGAGGAWTGRGGVGGAATVGGGTLTGGAGGLVELGAGNAGAGGNAAGGVTYIYGGDKTGSGAAGFVQLGLNSSAAAVGGGVVIGSATGSDKGAGTLNIAGTIWSNGTQGKASFGPAAVTSITIKNGLVTAIS